MLHCIGSEPAWQLPDGLASCARHHAQPHIVRTTGRAATQGLAWPGLLLARFCASQLMHCVTCAAVQSGPLSKPVHDRSARADCPAAASVGGSLALLCSFFVLISPLDPIQVSVESEAAAGGAALPQPARRSPVAERRGTCRPAAYLFAVLSVGVCSAVLLTAACFRFSQRAEANENIEMARAFSNLTQVWPVYKPASLAGAVVRLNGGILADTSCCACAVTCSSPAVRCSWASIRSAGPAATRPRRRASSR